MLRRQRPPPCRAHPCVAATALVPRMEEGPRQGHLQPEAQRPNSTLPLSTSHWQPTGDTQADRHGHALTHEPGGDREPSPGRPLPTGLGSVHAGKHRDAHRLEGAEGRSRARTCVTWDVTLEEPHLQDAGATRPAAPSHPPGRQLLGEGRLQEPPPDGAALAFLSRLPSRGAPRSVSSAARCPGSPAQPTQGNTGGQGDLL